MKKIAVLSTGQWTGGSRTRTPGDMLRQSIDLAVAAEQLGADGAYFRIHHFARQLAAPFPLLAAIGAKTSRIELGTAVIDMRYENPLRLAEDAATADLIAGGRLQLGLGRGVVIEQAVDGYRHFGRTPAPGLSAADMAKAGTERFREALAGDRLAEPNPGSMYPNPPGRLRVEPYSPGLRDRIWWGAGSYASGAWAARLGLNLQQSATVEDDGSGAPLHAQQRRQIDYYRKIWQQSGHPHEPRVSVFRTVNVHSGVHSSFGFEGGGGDHIATIDRTRLVFGRSYAGDPDALVTQLGRDTAIEAADTLMLTVDNELGVENSIRLIQSILIDIAPALGWR